MNKKFIGILAALVVLGCTNVFALGIGAQFGASPSTGTVDAGAALTFKLDNKAPVFALDVGGIGTDYIAIGLTADWWAANPKISGGFGWFYGAGASGGINGVGGDSLSLYAAGRVFIGLNWFVVSPFELYLQGAWQPGFGVTFANNARAYPMLWKFPINLGFRFWF